jgi:formyltetrahydrofolate deformylase
MIRGTLLLNCPDAKGIVYHVTKFLFERGANVLDARQHLEELDNRFFMRVLFDCSDMDAPKSRLPTELRELEVRFDMCTEISFSDAPKRMAIMVSKYDHCLYDLFLRHQYGEIAAVPAVVVSNHADLAHVAEAFKVPFFHVPVAKGEKDVAEEEALRLFRDHRIDFVVLARYMQVLSPRMVNAYPNRIINVHHGFLPAFQGARPYHQAYEKGVKLIGATSHYVTEELDTGPIIEQETVRVNHSHSVQDMLALGRDIERRVLARAVQAHAADVLMLYQNRTILLG